MKRRSFLTLGGATVGLMLAPLVACDESGLTAVPPTSDSVTSVASLYIGAEESLVLSEYGATLTCYGADGRLVWSHGGAHDELNGATALVVHDDLIYVVDSGNQRLIVMTLDGQIRDTWNMDHAGRLNGVVIANEAVYVADTTLSVIHVLGLDGSRLDTLGTDILNGPTGLAWYDGQLYVADGGSARVHVLDASGRHTATLGEAAPMGYPRSIAVRASGDIVIADPVARQIFEFDRNGTPIDAYRPQIAGASEVNVHHAVLAQDGSLWVHAVAATM